MNYLLPILILLPAAGAVVAAVWPRPAGAKGWAVLVSLATFVVALFVALNCPDSGSTLAAPAWLAFGSASLPTVSLRIDAISVCLVLLTAILTPLAILSTLATTSITKDRPRQFYAWMLALESALLAAFCARDLLLFYACFELTLVPSYFLIGIWGGPDRREAAVKFFLYTFAASVFTLAAIVYVGARCHTFDIPDVVRLVQHGALSAHEQFWVALGLLAAFVVKAAVFPLHTWLPLAYTEAPTSVTVLLAGVMPKLGTYGILRLAIPIGLVAAPGADTVGITRSPAICIVLGLLCVAGILYGAMIAWVQRDMKRMLAYSSFSHLGLCVLGLLSLDLIGAQGSLLYMVNHGISTGGLFLVAGMIFDRYATHDRAQFGGLARKMPKLACFLVLFAMASIGLPGLNGFVSEFLCLLGPFGVASHGGPAGQLATSPLNPWFGGVAAIGMVLSAVYMLGLVNGLLFGPTKTPAPKGSVPARDLSGREVAILAPLAVLVVALGIFPGLVLAPTLTPVSEALRPQTGEVVAPILAHAAPPPAAPAPSVAPVAPAAVAPAPVAVASAARP